MENDDMPLQLVSIIALFVIPLFLLVYLTISGQKTIKEGKSTPTETMEHKTYMKDILQPSGDDTAAVNDHSDVVDDTAANDDHSGVVVDDTAAVDDHSDVVDDTVDDNVLGDAAVSAAANVGIDGAVYDTADIYADTTRHVDVTKETPCDKNITERGAIAKCLVYPKVIPIPTLLTANARHAGLYVQDVARDGNCLFSAVADQLQIRHTDNNSTYTAGHLRNMAIQHLRRHPPHPDETWSYSSFIVDEPWDDYLQRMSQDKEWGDHVMLQVLADCYRRTIVVLYGNGPHRSWVQPNPTLPGESTPVLYVGFDGTNHYVSLRPIQQEIDAMSSSPATIYVEDSNSGTDDSTSASTSDADGTNDYEVVPISALNINVGDNGTQIVNVPQSPSASRDYRTVVNIAAGTHPTQIIHLHTTFLLLQDVIDYIQHALDNQLNVNGKRLVVKITPAHGENSFTESFDPVLIESLNNDGRQEFDNNLAEYNLQIDIVGSGCIELVLFPKSMKCIARFLRTFYNGDFAKIIKYIYSLETLLNSVDSDLPKRLDLDVSLRIVQQKGGNNQWVRAEKTVMNETSPSMPWSRSTKIEKEHRSRRPKEAKQTNCKHKGSFEQIYQRCAKDVGDHSSAIENKQNSAMINGENNHSESRPLDNNMSDTPLHLSGASSTSVDNPTSPHFRKIADQTDTEDRDVVVNTHATFNEDGINASNANSESNTSNNAKGLRLVFKPKLCKETTQKSSAEIGEVLKAIINGVVEEAKKNQLVVQDMKADVTVESEEGGSNDDDLSEVEVKKYSLKPHLYKMKMLQRRGGSRILDSPSYVLSTRKVPNRKVITDRKMWEKISSSIIRLLTKEDIPVGTGFLVGKKYVLTCYHVVLNIIAQRQESGDGFVVIQTVCHGRHNPIIVKPVYHCERLDVAILKIQCSKKQLTIPSIEIADVQPGDPFYLVGSTLEGTSLTTEQIVFQGSHSFRHFDSAKNIPFSSKKFFAGASGSPCLIQRQGNVYLGAILVGRMSRKGERNSPKIHFGLKMTALYDALSRLEPELCDSMFGEYGPVSQD